MLEQHDRLDEIGYFSKVFGYFLMTAIFISPISGTVIDKTVAFFSGGNKVDPCHGSMAVHCALTTIFGALYSLCAYTNIPDLQVWSDYLLKAFTQFYQIVFALRNCLLSLPSGYNKHEHLNSIWHQFSMWPSSCSSFTGRLHLLDRPPSSVCCFRVIYFTIALDWWAHLPSGLVLVRKFSGKEFMFHTSLKLNFLGYLEWAWIK